MAVANLGGIVTEIAGSIGGLNFRRYRGTTVLSNKSNGGGRSQLLSNSSLAVLRQINTQWLNLSEANRNLWVQEAKIYKFPNKFGKLRTLTAKQLYTKLMTPSLMVGALTPDVNSLNSAIKKNSITAITADSGGTFDIAWTINTDQTLLLVQVQKVDSFTQAKIFNRKKYVGLIWIKSNSHQDIGSEVEAFCGKWITGQKFFCYLTQVNASGFRDTTVVFEVTST